MLRRILRQPQPASLTPERAAEARENAATIRRIPPSQLPHGPAREALIALALAGYDVYAYTPVASDRYTIWLRPAQRWQDGRMSCADWIARFAAGELPEPKEPGEPGEARDNATD